MEIDSIYSQNAASLDAIVNLLKTVQTFTLEEGQSEKLSEIEFVIDAFIVLSKTADPLLISVSHRDTISTTLGTIESDLIACTNDNEAYVAELDSAFSEIQSLKNLFPYLVPKPNEDGVDNLRELVVRARQSATQHLRIQSAEFKKTIDEIVGKFATQNEQLEERFAEEHNSLRKIFEERASTFEKEIKEKQDEFEEELTDALANAKTLQKLSTETTETINSQKDRLDSAIAEFQKQFSERIGEYQRQFSESEEDRRKKLESSIQSRDRTYKKETNDRTAEINSWRDEFTSNFNTDKKQFESDSQALIEKLRKFAKEAEVTLGLMSEKSLQNDFITQADREKARAWSWNLATFVTIGLLLLAIGYIFIHTIIIPSAADPVAYSQILSKFLVTGVIGIVARWTSRQANRHLAEERRLRRLALELATINPFLNNLPPEIQHKVKEILAMRYYGNDHNENPGFGEISPIQEGDGGIKSMPEVILDSIRKK